MKVAVAPPTVKTTPRRPLAHWSEVFWFKDTAAFWRDPLTFLRDASQRGPVVRFSLMATTLHDLLRLRWAQPNYLLNAPELVKTVYTQTNRAYTRGATDPLAYAVLGNGLLSSENPLWLRQRRMMHPAFHKERLKALTLVMARSALALVDDWNAPARQGHPLDAAREMQRLTLRIVGEALFGVDVSEQVEQVTGAFTRLNGYISDATRNPLPYLLPTRQRKVFFQAVAELRQAATAIIENRRQHPDQQPDILSLLLDARDEATGRGMSDQLICDEVLGLMIAGHDTTANLLAWTWFLLSEHPEVETRLHQELASVLAGTTPTADDLASLPYCRMVIEETLRLYPPAWLVSRFVPRGVVLGGYPIPQRAQILTCPFTMHRDSAYWERPEVFEPERFDPTRSANRPAYAYFPFGGGPRRCIGNEFALVEAQIILATLAQHFRLRVLPGRPVEPEPLATLRIRGGLPVIVERRTSKRKGDVQ